MGQLGTHSNFNAFMQIPLVSQSGRQVFFFGVYPSFTEYARGTSILNASSEYAAVLAHFGNELLCDTSLWEGRPIIQPQ